MEQCRKRVLVLIGLPGSTKSTYANNIKEMNKSCMILSNDIQGKKHINMIDKCLEIYDTIIIDNTNLTNRSRSVYEKYDPEYIYFESSIDHCIIRILTRMYKKYYNIFFDGISIERDTHVFPITVLFTMYNKIELPLNYTKITMPPPCFPYKNKGLFLNIDKCIQYTSHLEYKYPTCAKDVLIINTDIVKLMFDKYISLDYNIIGISDQEGISIGIVSNDDVMKCMNETRKRLGYTESQFPICWCSHQAFPLKCYCKKPQIGLFVYCCEKYEINPNISMYIGSCKIDEMCAEKIGMKFVYSNVFFKV